MNFQDIRKMAMAMDLKTHRIKKTDMILAIQRAESNIDCYGSERVDSCQEQPCLWRSDCVTLSNNGEGSA